MLYNCIFLCSAEKYMLNGMGSYEIISFRNKVDFRLSLFSGKNDILPAFAEEPDV